MNDEHDDIDLTDCDAEEGLFEDPRALDELRRRVFESVGLEFGPGILYGTGLNLGMLDGLRVSRDFDSPLDEGPMPAGGVLPLSFAPSSSLPGDAFSGRLDHGLEADLHLDRYGRSDTAMCHVTAGYAAGWYTALLGSPHLVKETACVTHGADACTFTARPVEAWLAEEEAWAQDLLPYLDFERMREAAGEKLDEAEGVRVEGTMMGGFDPMSPAVHVWGSVMVLPYSGRLDSEAALAAIQEDLGPRYLQVVVVDVTGAEIDSVEASGLLQLFDTLSSVGLETVLVGMDDAAAEIHLRDEGRVALPLRAPDVTAGISLAFQISRVRTPQS